MRYLLALAIFLAPLAALADAAQARLLQARMPRAVLTKVKRDAPAYVEDVLVLIEGFGRDGAIDRQGLQNVVALARAEARALAFRRLQGADLDGDGSIAGEELAVAAAAASAVARGRLVVNFAQSDSDGDGRVTAAELQAYANAVALQAFSADKAQAVMSVLYFDTDGDGRVTGAEVEFSVAALASAAGQTREIQNEFQVQADDHQRDQPSQQSQPDRRDQGTHLGAI